MKFVEVERGRCRALLPLNTASANQHGTHQAMLLGMLGDYAGGMALLSVIPGEPVVGVHACRDNGGMSLWSTDVAMKCLAPSVSAVTATAQVSEREWAGLIERYAAGRSIFQKVEVVFTGEDGHRVAVAEFTYFLKQRSSLLPRSAEEPAHVMYRHGQSTSARLIAALRAQESAREHPLFDDRWSQALGGPQGAVISEKFGARIPWLVEMVAARTRHADDALRAAYQAGVRQLVLAPAGLDSRPFRLSAECPDLRVFELDLPEMLAERQAVVSKLDVPSVNRTLLPLNFEFQEPLDALVSAGLDAHAPVFVVYEGCAMYFEPEVSPLILKKMAALIRNDARSRLWFDLPSARAVNVRLDHPSMHAFMDGMARLGAPFRFGHDEPSELLRQCELVAVDDVASDYARPSEDPVFDQYRFLLVRAPQ